MIPNVIKTPLHKQVIRVKDQIKKVNKFRHSNYYVSVIKGSVISSKDATGKCKKL